MYNYQTFLKEKKLHQHFQNIQQRCKREQNTRQRKSYELISGHKKRIENFMMSMIEKPVKVKIFKNPNYEPRPFNKSKNIGNSSFHVSYSNQKRRIQEIESSNAILDHVPFTNTFSHQFRSQKQNGIKPWRFKPMNNLLRIKDHLYYEMQNQLPNQRIKRGNGQLLKNHINITQEKFAKKKLLPSLHEKTHFKTIQTIYAQTPNLLSGQKSTASISHDSSIHSSGYQSGNNLDLQLKNNHVNKNSYDITFIKKGCKQILIKCNLLQPRNSFKQKQPLRY